MTDEVVPSRDAHFPGVQDFQLLSSDGYTFHLSRQVLTQASGFFADMFAMGSSDPGSQPVVAAEEFTVLHPVLCLVYARHGVTAPSISSFTTLTTLYRVAEKYEMQAVLQCLLSVLFHTRSIVGLCVIPFVKTHPIPSLALLMLNGCQFGVQAAMQECILADKGIAASDIDVSGVEIDVRMVHYIHSERQNRIQSIMSRIEGWPGCGLSGSTAECLRGPWHMTLRKVVEENPTLVALYKHFYEKRGCPACGRDVTSTNQYNINALFGELRNLEELAIPLPSVCDLPTVHIVIHLLTGCRLVVHTLTQDHEAEVARSQIKQVKKFFCYNMRVLFSIR